MNKPSGFDSGYDKYYEYIHSDRWQKIRNERLIADNFRCALCGSPDQLHVHHIFYPAEYGTEDINDLITVCQTCHGVLENIKKYGRNVTKWRVCNFHIECVINASSKMEVYDFLNANNLPPGDIACYFLARGKPCERLEVIRTNLPGIMTIKKYFGDEDAKIQIFQNY